MNKLQLQIKFVEDQMNSRNVDKNLPLLFALTDPFFPFNDPSDGELILLVRKIIVEMGFIDQISNFDQSATKEQYAQLFETLHKYAKNQVFI